jgi:hypothetical protein
MGSNCSNCDCNQEDKLHELDDRAHQDPDPRTHPQRRANSGLKLPIVSTSQNV